MRAIPSCPLCQSSAAIFDSVPNANLYSEMLAELTGMKEEVLLERVANVKCDRCGLIYKSEWFPRESLVELFTSQVPSHPKGWDVLSGRFSPDNFQVEVGAYEKAIADNDPAEIARYRRALSSIVDSIPELEAGTQADELLHAIEQCNINALRAAKGLLERVMNEPTPYKRFSGFSASGLWQYMDDKIGPIQRYAEVGCPLWGLIPRAIEKGRIATWLDRIEPNYWSSGCRQQGLHCTNNLIATTGARRANWNEQPEKKHDAIGAFQYLDHLESPGQFINELFERANAAAIILDAVDQPVAIQHFTGWTVQAIEWLANQHGCCVDSGFEEIRQSGNVLYLLQKT
jgi:hypothetical protein